MQSDQLDFNLVSKPIAKKTLLVEGEDNKDGAKLGLDRKVIEAFLGHINPTWQSTIQVESSKSSEKILRRLRADATLWGLIDRDARTPQEIIDLQTELPNLLVLPRWTVENYFIVPDELVQMLPSSITTAISLGDIDIAKNDWIQHGALWQVLYENGAFHFCRGHESGYPMALLAEPILNKAQVQSQLDLWYQRLLPSDILSRYERRLNEFTLHSDLAYTHHIHGKNFFRQIVVSRVLNKGKDKKSVDSWLIDIVDNGITTCPPDIAPILQRLF